MWGAHHLINRHSYNGSPPIPLRHALVSRERPRWLYLFERPAYTRRHQCAVCVGRFLFEVPMLAVRTLHTLVTSGNGGAAGRAILRFSGTDGLFSPKQRKKPRSEFKQTA